MTKEQFLIFKSDFKKSVEATVLQNKYERLYDKMYYNAGFSSEEEQKTICDKIYEQKTSIEKTRTGRDIEVTYYAGRTETIKNYNPLHGYSCTTHWAYYCAKHRFNESERKAYCEEEFKKLRIEKQNYISFRSRLQDVEKIIKFYEEV